MKRRDDLSQPWQELAERARRLAHMTKGPDQAALFALADRYEARAKSIAERLETTQQVLRTLRRCIRSNWELELLLLLANEADRAWNVAELTRRLRSSRRAVTGALSALRSAGLVVQDAEGLQRYEPHTRELADLVRQLQQACAAFPVSMIAAIFSGPE
ncbi:MAG TPA: hypothetical protein VJ770_20465 [Stellaceae bacterium]|nr:hypothetical protein [Stellaceae bacterium]